MSEAVVANGVAALRAFKREKILPEVCADPFP